jgi:SOS-response transcriptional repressor LexA
MKAGWSRLKEKVFKFIKQFIADNGYAPTVREIAKGIKCVHSTVSCYLQVLKLEGYIDYKYHMPRTIVILKELEAE